MPLLCRQPLLLRVLVMLAVLTCIVVKPALGLAGELHRELHELAHAAAQADRGDVLPPLADEAREHEPAAGWHGMLHIDLCCSNYAMPSNPLQLPPPARPGVVLPYHVRGLLPAPEADRLRPPIRT